MLENSRVPLPILWKGDRLMLLDQLKLPNEEIWVEVVDYEGGARAIKDMIVRGAPAIGVTAAYSYALAFQDNDFTEERSARVVETLLSTRPTAVNLQWALEQMQGYARQLSGSSDFYRKLLAEAIAIHEEDISMNQQIGEHALELIPPGARILTHCNAGSLATGGYGTALGVIYKAYENGRVEKVWVDETRPFLQGARLTAYELDCTGVDYTLICDNMAASLMAAGKVDLVVVGSDRIVANGDVANKIGTYNLAVLCHYHKIPFYVAAPYSTIDSSLASGDLIPIEERAKEELGTFNGRAIAISQENIFNPGFDVTPGALVHAIITEKGVFRQPYLQSLRGAVQKEQ